MNRLNALTFKQLRALHAIVETGTISAAADKLGLTPPAIHSQLKTLEASFGCVMASRDNPSGGFQATAEGTALLEAHDLAHSALVKAVHRIESLRKGMAGTVILGVVSTGKYVAPALVARLKARFPQIEVILQIGNRDRIISNLDAARLDLAIMGRPPRQPEVTAYGIGAHPHVLIAPPGHPLAGLENAGAGQILAENFIMREPGSGTRILAMRFLDQIGEGYPFTFTEMESNESIKQAVIAGLGIGLISAHTVLEELKTGRLALVRAARLPIVRQWFILHRADQVPTGAMVTIMDHIRDNSAELLRQDDARTILAQSA